MDWTVCYYFLVKGFYFLSIAHRFNGCLFSFLLAHLGAQQILWGTDVNTMMFSIYWTKLKVFMACTVEMHETDLSLL